MQELIDHSCWFKILNASANEVNSFIYNKQYQGKLGLYLSILKEYYDKNVEGIAFHINKTRDQNIIALAKTRKAIIEKDPKFNEEILEEVLDNDIFSGEGYYLLGKYYLAMGNKEEAKDNFICAYSDFIGKSPRKAINSLLKYVMCDRENKSDIISDLKNIYHKALEHQEFLMAGVTLTKISKEEHKKDQHKLAMEYINQALDLLSKYENDLSYFKALSHKTHLLFMLGDNEKAINEFKKLLRCPFESLRFEIEMLAELGKLNFKEIYDRHFAKIWKQRKIRNSQETYSKEVKLTPLENNLLQLLSEGIEDIPELIKNIYGKEVDFQVAQNRFRVLVSRLIKKQPGILTRDAYKISLVNNDANNQAI